MTYAKKRRILLLVLLLPTILAIAVITHIYGQEGRARHAAKKWLKEHHPQSELVSISFGETNIDGNVTKQIDCGCYDKEYGFYYNQKFENNGFRYVPTVDFSYNSYDAMREMQYRAEHLSGLLQEAKQPCEVMCYPTDYESRIAVLPEDTSPEALAAFCDAMTESAKHVPELTDPEILICTDAVRSGILSADRITVWRERQNAMPRTAVAAAAALLDREFTCSGLEFTGTPAEIIAAAQQNMPLDDSTVWLLALAGKKSTLTPYQLT